MPENIIIDSEQFLENMDSLTTPYCWRRAGDTPTNRLELYQQTFKSDPEKAGAVLMSYLRATEADAVRYGCTPLEIFQLHRRMLDEEYSTVDFSEIHTLWHK